LPEARDQLVQQIRSERANALRRAYIGELLKDHPPHGDRDWGDRRRTFNSQAAPVPAAGSASSIAAAFSSKTASILASRRFRSARRRSTTRRSAGVQVLWIVRRGQAFATATAMNLDDFACGIALMRPYDRRGRKMSITELFDHASAASRVDSITIRRPDDFHVHLRDGAMLKAVLPFTSAQFARGVIMPNLVPPVTSVAMAVTYRERILAARPEGSDFLPLMTCYLTDATAPEEIETGFRDGVWVAAKLYPAGATTNAHYGVTDIPALAPVLERMEKIGMPVLIHGEATDPTVDIFDREAVFMETSLLPLLKRHPGLKVVIEHVTTAETADIVRAHAARAAGTITPHHLVVNRTSIFQGGLRPHLYCLPVAKREHHRLALRKAATSGEPCFFIGTDTAPHRRTAKETECCSAGIFGGATALQTYVQVFDEEGALERFEAFASESGARFYGLALNRGTVTLERRASPIVAAVAVEDTEVVVFQGGQTLPWSVGAVTF
jgi:dihydroorotase